MDFTFLITFALSLVSARAVYFPSTLVKHVGEKYHGASHSTSTVTGCSPDKPITERKGYIRSPNYPDWYPNHVSCSWHINGNIGDVITITLHDLDIEESGVCENPPCCIFNWLKIGPSFNGTEQQYCGQDDSYQPTFVSTTNKVWIKFHISTVRSSGRGFKILFSIDPPTSSTCDKDDFRCANGACVPSPVRCNGFNDCSDGSDEAFCSAFCPMGLSCRSLWFCYEKKKHCDGVTDCLDFSDEMGCSPCPANETRCGGDSDQCYNPLTQRCSGIMDCLNGADERDCLHACPGKMMCASGLGCYLPDEHCNGIAQCSDSSDEKNCGADLCNYERGGFLCGNGHCIREMWKCDRTNDCGDGTDEYNCLRNSVLTAAIMGSLICALLLVIAISCTCRLHALRALESSMSNRESSMSRMSPEFLFREPPPSYAVAVGEHQRNLYVENVHYNPCPRRGRRRIRRARRHQETRRGSVSLLDNMVHRSSRTMPGPQLHFPFPCLPVVSGTANRSPSPETPQTSCSNFSSTTCASVTSSSEVECWDNAQNNRETPISPNIIISNAQLRDVNAERDKDKDSGEMLSPNAESSFSQLPMVHIKTKSKGNTENNRQILPTYDQSEGHPSVTTDCVPISFHNVLSGEPDPCQTVIIDPMQSQNLTSNCCDNDVQPLIT